ncbi:MAG: hypothetical protein Q8Q06_02290 [bacterium]|nr:hypothetical protein [bacterium]
MLGETINTLLEAEAGQAKEEYQSVNQEELEAMIKDGADVIYGPALLDQAFITRAIHNGQSYECKHDKPLRFLIFPNILHDGEKFLRRFKDQEAK